MKASELRPHSQNWRVHPDSQKNALRSLLADIGFAGALLARELPDGTLGLIDGHLRAETTPDQEVPVLILDVTEDEAKKILLTFDSVASLATPDAEKLEALMNEVSFDDPAIKAMLEQIALMNEIDISDKPTPIETTEDDPPIDKADELQDKWHVKLGDLWAIPGKAGCHRLLCGDSADSQSISRLMAGERATCVFTDPPYGVSVAAKNRLLNTVQKAGWCLTDIIDDDLSPEQLKAKLLPAFENLKANVMADDCTLFVSIPEKAGLGMMVMSMMQDAKLPPRHVLIWKKNSPTFSMGRLDYDYQHESILLTWDKSHKRPMLGKHRTSVWEIDKPRKSEFYPTMKPVELYANAYLNNSDAGDKVCDIYAGSGTAFVAAEQTGRIAYGVELSEKYCAVILERMSLFTGAAPTKIEAEK